METSVEPDKESMEKDLVDRITFRIASCRTDEEFEVSINKFLPMVLLKLASTNESVRTKVMELLVHVNRRVKSRPEIKLPVAQLLLQYQDPTATSFVTNFTIIYLKLGIPRLTQDEQLKMIGKILRSIVGKPQSHQDSIILLLMPLMPSVTIPMKEEERKNILGLDDPNVAKIFADFALDVLMMPYIFPKEVPAANAPSVPAPAGMSQFSFKRITHETPLTAESLEAVKVALVKILVCGPYNPTDVALHLAVACADSRHSVASVGDNEIKRFASSINWEDRDFVTKLYNLFLGTIVPKDAKKCTVNMDMRKTAANTRIRLKLVPLLMKSAMSSRLVIPAIQTIFECLNGKDTKPNLRSKGLLFTAHFVSQCPDGQFPAVAPVLFSEMKKIVLKENVEGSDDIKTDLFMRNFAVTIIPKILIRQTDLLKKDLGFVTSFLGFLSNQAGPSIQEFKMVTKTALAELIPVLKKIIEEDASVSSLMEGVVMNFFQDENHEVREVIVRYASTLFPLKHVPSKFVLLLSLGDLNGEVRKNAAAALDALRKDGNLPLFTEIMSYVKVKSKIVANITITADMLSYIHTCLEKEVSRRKDSTATGTELEALTSFVTESFNQRKSDSANWDALVIYIDWLKNLTLTPKANVIRSRFVSLKDVSYYLLEIFLALPQEALGLLLTDINLWRTSLSVAENQNDDSVQILCQITAFLLDSLRDSATQQKYLEELLQTTSTKASHVEKQVVSILVVTFFIVDYAKEGEFEELAQKVTTQALAWLESSSTTNLEKVTACNVIEELAKFNRIGKKNEPKAISEKLLTLLPSKDKNFDIEESATKALGFLVIGNATVEFENSIVDSLLSNGSKIIGITYHFTLGDVVSCVLLGSAQLICKRLSKKKLVAKYSNLDERDLEVKRVVDLILQKYINHTKKSIRNAACVWVFSILKNAGKLLKNHTATLVKVQGETLRLMSRTIAATPIEGHETVVFNTDVTEDITPKALSLIYEAATEEGRPQLIKELITVLNMTGNEATQTSQNLVALKELLQLASECTGRPSIFYDFMNIVSYQKWGSGDKSKEFFAVNEFKASYLKEIEPYTSKLLPFLYMCTFDPQPVIRSYYSFVWEFTTESGQRNRFLNTHLSTMLSCISTALEDSLWRRREAACGCASNLLTTLGPYSFKSYTSLFPELFETLCRVTDDMKETVRLKGEATLKALFKTIIELCSSTAVGKQVSEANLELILPTLIDKGLGNPAETVREMTMKAVMEITEHAGPALKKHISVLSVCYLESLSTFESQMINYLSTRVEGESALHEKLDSARVAAVRTSPIMNALKKCVPYIDAEVLTSLMPKVVELLRHSVGLCTKAGCMLFIVELVQSCPNEVKPYAEKTIKALVKQLSNRNITVQKCSADTIGNLIKLLGDASCEALLRSYKEQYFEDDYRYRKTVAILVQTIAKYSGDVVRKHASLLMPFAWYAMHEPKGSGEHEDDSVQNVEKYEELWNEFTPGSETGVKLYMDEILTLVFQGLESQIWVNKHQAARCLAAALEKVGPLTETPLVIKLYTVLKSSLFGRTWTGKESILEALTLLIILNKDVLLKVPVDQDAHMNNAIDLVLKECKKQNMDYKKAAVLSASRIFEAHETEKFGIYFVEVLQTLLSGEKGLEVVAKSDDEKDEQEEKEAKQHANQMQFVALAALKTSWPKTVYEFQKPHFDSAVAQLSQIHLTGVYKVKIEVMLTLNSMTKNLKLSAEDASSAHGKAILELLEVINDSLATSKYPELQMQGLDLLDAVLSKVPEQVKKNDQMFGASLRLISTENGNGMMREKATSLVKRL